MFTRKTIEEFTQEELLEFYLANIRLKKESILNESIDIKNLEEKISEFEKANIEFLASRESDSISEEQFQFLQEKIAREIDQMMTRKNKKLESKTELEASLRLQEDILNSEILDTDEKRARRETCELYFITRRFMNDQPLEPTSEEIAEVFKRSGRSSNSIN